MPSGRGLGISRAGEYNNKATRFACPRATKALEKIFADTEFRQGNWYVALKQAPAAIVPRGLPESHIR